MKRTPYQKIMQAAKRGTGLRLTADEVYALSQDNAIEVRASGDDEQQSDPELYQAEQDVWHAPPRTEAHAEARAKFLKLLAERNYID
jgi:hypothetical protein